MKHLTKLDLSHNQLSTIPDQNRKVLLEISKTSPLTIDLTGNILRCTCSNLDFLEWMLKPTFNFTGVEKYRCSDKDGKITNLGNLHDKISDMKKRMCYLHCPDYCHKYRNNNSTDSHHAAVLNRYTMVPLFYYNPTGFTASAGHQGYCLPSNVTSRVSTK